MNTIEIINIIKNNKFSKNIFCGVFLLDLLPQVKIKKPCSIIVNTDISTKPGQHWIGIYLPKFGPIEYFDSFGLPPIENEIIKFINFNGKKFIYNNLQIQSNKSKTCGKFCIIFILFRSRKISIKTFINLFTNKKNFNEKIINKIFEKII